MDRTDVTTRTTVTVAQARARAASTVRNRIRGWLADPAAAGQDSLSIALRPPTEREVSADADQARDWARSWLRYRGPGTVEWSSRRWPSFGTQDVPTHLRLAGAQEISEAAGEAERFLTLTRRQGELAALATAAGFPDIVAGSFARWEVLSDNDFTRLVATVRWLLAHPGSGLFIRQLPVEGVDTKWLGAHRGLVERLVAGATGSPDLGIRSLPHLYETALLDDALLPGMARVFAAAAADLALLQLPVRRVVILENKEGVYALPPMRDTVALCGGGNAVVSLASIEWLQLAEVIYWGDLDTHGFAILDRLRCRVPHVRSALMDAATLDRWHHLAVAEPVPATGDFPTLTDDEFAVLDRLRTSGLRLEQERIPWPYVLGRLAAD